MSNREPLTPDPEPTKDYEAPIVESHLDEQEIEREVAYAGNQTVPSIAIVDGG